MVLLAAAVVVAGRFFMAHVLCVAVYGNEERWMVSSLPITVFGFEDFGCNACEKKGIYLSEVIIKAG